MGQMILLLTDSDGLWVLKVDVFLEVPADKHGTLSFNLEQTSISESKHVTLSGKNKQVRCSFVVTIPKVIIISCCFFNHGILILKALIIAAVDDVLIFYAPAHSKYVHAPVRAYIRLC